MDKIVRIVSKQSKLLTIIFLFAAEGCVFLAKMGNIGGAFMPSIGNLLLAFFLLLFVGAIPALIVFKKEDYLKLAFFPVLSYWLVSTVTDALEGTSLAVKGQWGALIALGVFLFFIACVFIGALAFFILFILKKQNKVVKEDISLNK